MSATARAAAPKSPAWRTLVASLGDALTGSEQPRALIAERIIRRHLESPHLLHGLQLELNTERYQRLLLYADPEGRFSLLAIVWPPNTSTPLHAHYTWCSVGIASGELVEERYRADQLQESVPPGPIEITRLCCGQTIYEDTAGCFAHRLCNRGQALAISLHVYGVSGDRVEDGVNRILAL